MLVSQAFLSHTVQRFGSSEPLPRSVWLAVRSIWGLDCLLAPLFDPFSLKGLYGQLFEGFWVHTIFKPYCWTRLA